MALAYYYVLNGIPLDEDVKEPKRRDLHKDQEAKQTQTSRQCPHCGAASSREEPDRGRWFLPHDRRPTKPDTGWRRWCCHAAVVDACARAAAAWATYKPLYHPPMHYWYTHQSGTIGIRD
jgi:hypothetical protein